MNEVIPVNPDPTLTDEEYAKKLDQLAEFADWFQKAEGMSQKDTIAAGDILNEVFRDQHWVEERNAAREQGAKTPLGRKPVAQTNRSQFATWVFGRWPEGFSPRRTYQLLDVSEITKNFLYQVQISPTTERQVRPLKSLLSVANGGGVRIEPVWKLACETAMEAGREEPTHTDVRDAISQWKQENLPKGQHRKETATDQAWVKERKALAAWRELLRAGADEQINHFVTAVREDIQNWNRDHG